MAVALLVEHMQDLKDITTSLIMEQMMKEMQFQMDCNMQKTMAGVTNI